TSVSTSFPGRMLGPSSVPIVRWNCSLSTGYRCSIAKCGSSGRSRGRSRTSGAEQPTAKNGISQARRTLAVIPKERARLVPGPDPDRGESSHADVEVDEEPVAREREVRQIVGEVGEVVADAQLHVVADVAVHADHRAAAAVGDVGQIEQAVLAPQLPV